MPKSPPALAELPERQLIEVINAGIEHTIPPMHGLGIHLVELTARRAVAVAPLAGNANHLGTMYAATIFGAAEMLGGALFFPRFDPQRYYPTVKSLQIDYHRPATSDIRATAEFDDATWARLPVELAAAGKVEFVLAAKVTDDTGTVVATTSGIYQIRSR
ncbi:YiiD C-terminal domain-containing protein [Nocardia neocaledoniensis]|uniref:YiiD C-terminal domain-containing protein n=1 Tax=Nocardia neocaledoniensis TaxID=236511 RepID=UPI0024547229|nr:YiiD C-terminal domain-containing protein [Nocardia neocaledoniensis]